MKFIKINIIALFSLCFLVSCYKEEEEGIQRPSTYDGIVYHYEEVEGRPIYLSETVAEGIPLPNVEVRAYYEGGSYIYNNSYVEETGTDISDEEGRFQLPYINTIHPIKHQAKIGNTPYKHYAVLGARNNLVRIPLFNRVPIIFEFFSNDFNQPVQLDQLVYFIDHEKINFNNNTMASNPWDNSIDGRTLRMEVAENMNLILNYRYKFEDPSQIRTLKFYSGDDPEKVFRLGL